MLKNLLILSGFVLLAFSANGQTDTVFAKESISFHPFHLINNGIRIDYDRHLGKGHWIQIGPQFYVSEKSGDIDKGREFKELLGAGVSIFHRIYVGKEKPSSGTYFSYGFTYNLFNLKYNNTTATQIEDATEINKFGGDIIIGYQIMYDDKLAIDLYAGLGGRYADISFKGDTHRKFNDHIYDYGFTGNVIIIGIRLGFGF